MEKYLLVCCTILNASSLNGSHININFSSCQDEAARCPLCVSLRPRDLAGAGRHGGRGRGEQGRQGAQRLQRGHLPQLRLRGQQRIQWNLLHILR